MPVQKNLPIWKGNTFRLPLRYLQVVDGNKSPVDLTGSTLLFTAAWSTGTLSKATGDAGFALTGPTQGEAELNLSRTETLLLPLGQVRFEIERITFDERKTLLFGMLMVSDWISANA